MGTRFILGLAAAAVAGGTAFGQGPAAAPHPLGVRPEHGAYMICVKAYSGPQARGLAEELCRHVRDTHRAAAFLFEHGAEARTAEEAKQARARENQRKANEPFLRQMEEEKQKAAREGRAFVDQPLRYTVPKVTVPEQWAVLVGGFPSEESARAALDVVRKWAPPAERFMDQQFAVGDGAGRGTYINPFATATVFPNPTIRKQAGPPPVDPALVKMNSEEPLSLLQTDKGKKVTLLVKAFSTKTVAKSKDEAPGLLDALFGKGDDNARLLQNNANDARALALALRDPSMQPAAQTAADKFSAAYGHKSFRVPPLTAYLLHTRTGSLVTVGAYESEDDPELIAAGRILQYMEFEVKFDGGRTEKRRMFDNVIPIPIPRP